MAAAATMEVCPVVGTSNTMLPPSHPSVDLSQKGQTCPVTNATTDHHHNLSKHPGIPQSAANNAESCPALQKIVSKPEQKALDEEICPVIGTATSVLPPDHPSLSGKNDSDVCPVTNAKLGDHKGKVHTHPSVEGAKEGAVCPVVGKSA